MKKLSSYFSLIALLASFIAAPLNVVSETVESSQASSSQVEASSSSSSVSTQTDSQASAASTEDGQASSDTASQERSAQAAPKELTNVISNVVLWDKNNGREVVKKDGVYQAIENIKYAYRMTFDLSNYDKNFNDGDYFTIDIDKPFTVSEATFDLTDEVTGVVVGSAQVTSNGAGQGGKVTISLKNLEEYLKVKNAQDISEVRGTFFAEVSSSKTHGVITTGVNNVKNVGKQNFQIQVDSRRNTNNRPGIGTENFAKLGGTVSEKPYDSAALGKSGTYVHSWRARVNTSQKTYSSLVVSDKISTTDTGMQFIPETVKVVASEDGFKQGYYLENPQELTEGVDYTISYNADYTEMTVNLNNPGNKAYRLSYDTTAPLDSSYVGNTLSVTGDGSELPISDSNPKTSSYVKIESTYSAGGTIRLETGKRIVIHKTDQDTGAPLSGAVFEVTKPDGSKITLDPTDDSGITQSPRFTSEEIAQGQFTITEITAPTGYTLNKTPQTVTVTDTGVEVTMSNKKEEIQPVAFNIKAIKQLDGRELKKDEFEFILRNEQGEEVARAKNDADGNIIFTNLTASEVGTYNYTIEEVNDYATGITYDLNKVSVKAIVTNNNGQLEVTVTYANDNNTFLNVYGIPMPPSPRPTPPSGNNNTSSSSSSSDSSSSSESNTSTTSSTSESSVSGIPLAPGGSSDENGNGQGSSNSTAAVNSNDANNNSNTQTAENSVQRLAKSSSSKKSLPGTGEKFSMLMVAVGIVLVGLVGFYYNRTKKVE